MSNFWRNIKDFILSYSYDSGQYFLISFPKTGRTWLMYMINKMHNNEILKNNFIISEHDNSEIILENGYRNNPLDLFNYSKRYKYRRAKVIYLVRDPRDVVVSHFHQITKRSENPFFFKSISSFISDEIIGFNRIIYYYNLWFKNKNIPKDFLLVKYEDLISNGVYELKRISKFLGLDISNDYIRSIYEASTANKMRDKELKGELMNSNFFGNEKNYLKVRKASVGSYKEELSKSDIIYCNSKMRELNKYFNYFE